MQGIFIAPIKDLRLGYFLAKNRIYSVIFGGQISRCGRFLAKILSTGVDFKQVKNHLQDLRDNLYPSGVLGVGGPLFSGQ